MKAIAAYNRARIDLAPQEQLLVMLLEKAIEKEQVAREAIESGDRLRRNGALHHARAVFIELLSALDHTEAPEVTLQLATTWNWCLHQLLAVGKTGDLTLLGKVEDVTRLMHGAWLQALVVRDQEQEQEAAS